MNPHLPSAVVTMLLALSGCSTDMGVQKAYWGADPIRIHLANAATHVPGELDVYFHPADPGRAAVYPPFGKTMKIAAADGTDPWIATIDRQRAAYEGALGEALERAGRQCRVADAIPFPDLLMFEFALICEAPQP